MSPPIQKMFRLIQGGAYWRPNGNGFTNNKALAGLFSEEFAAEVVGCTERNEGPDRVTMMPADDFRTEGHALKDNNLSPAAKRLFDDALATFWGGTTNPTATVEMIRVELRTRHGEAAEKELREWLSFNIPWPVFPVCQEHVPTLAETMASNASAGELYPPGHGKATRPESLDDQLARERRALAAMPAPEAMHGAGDGQGGSDAPGPVVLTPHEE